MSKPAAWPYGLPTSSDSSCDSGFFVLVDQVGYAVQNHRPIVGGHGGPPACTKGLPGCVDGAVDVGRITLGHLGQLFTFAGVTGGKGLSTLGIRPFTPDEHLHGLR